MTNKQMLTFFLLWLIAVIPAQTQTFENITPKGFYDQDFRGMYFFNMDSGFLISNNGCVFETSKGVDSLEFNDEFIDGSLLDIYFFDKDTGVLIDFDDDFYRTTNGGKSWSLVHTIPPCEYHPCKGGMVDLEFYEETGYACGGDQLFADGTIMKTIDGGKTWTMIDRKFNDVFKSCVMLSKDTAFFYGGHGYYAKTYDGGDHWETGFVPSGKDHMIYFWDVQQVKDSLFYAGTHTGDLLISEDKGTTWQTQYHSSLTLEYFVSIHFLDQDTGYWIGDQGVYRTFDGGRDVSYFELNDGWGGLWSIQMFNSREGIVVGEHGRIFYTTDGFETWKLNIWGTTLFSDIGFVSQDTGYVNIRDGRLLKTTDGGATWNYLTYRMGVDAGKMLLPDKQTIYMGVDSLYRSRDAGENWEVFSRPNGVGVGWKTACSPDTIYVGYSPDKAYLNYSFDGGENWSYWGLWADLDMQMHHAYNIECKTGGVCLASGYANDRAGYVSRTTDYGLNWDTTYLGIPKKINGFEFFDKNKVIALGDSVIFRSTNDGLTWTQIEVPHNTYLQCDFYDSKTGVLIPLNDKRNLISRDGGRTWLTFKSEINLYYIDFVSPNEAFATSSRKIYKITFPRPLEISSLSDTTVVLNSASDTGLDVTYQVSAFFDPGNTCTAWLLSGPDDWSKAQSIGSHTSDTSNKLACTVPGDTPGGTYYIRLTSDNPADTSEPSIAINVINSTGIPTQASPRKETLSVYPNPVGDALTVSCSCYLSRVIITTLAGQTLLDQNNINQREIKIATSKYPHGIYFIKAISREGKVKTMKFEKQW